MKPNLVPAGVVAVPLIQVRQDGPDQHTAQLVGLPAVEATAPTREEAITQVQERLGEWLASGRLVALPVAQANPLMCWFGRADSADSEEQAYLAELARRRREDLERTLREDDTGCSNSSSTPTT